jgi:glycosyltransferase involved in cell wall biosynthesis/predicted TPR repeat methyltransferase
MSAIKRVGLFSDHTLGAGGGERYTFAIARALAERYALDFLAGGDDFRPDAAFFRRAFGTEIDYPALRFRSIASAEEMRRYDLLVNVSHFRVLPPLARRNVYVTFFPQLLSEWIPHYDAVVTVSRFSASWIERYWGLPGALVAYPSIDPDDFHCAPKEPVILSVGRFFEVKDGNVKNHALMIRAFKSLCDQGLRGWRLVLAGSSSEEQMSYVDRLEKEASGYPVELRRDAPFEELRDLYARASVYWHAAGLVDSGLTPTASAAEHFGITILEAMASGAVPVVADAGGAAEIVAAGENGFKCASPQEMADHTLRLIRDPEALARTGRAARERSRDFAFPRFASRMHEIVELVGSDVLDRAHFYFREGSFARAAELYTEAIDRFPREASPYFALAECFYRTGRRELMLMSIERGLAIEPNHPAAAQVKALAERLERQRREVAAVGSGCAFGEDYFERGAATGVSDYTAYDGNEWSQRHAAVIDEAFRVASCLEIGCAAGDFVREMRGRGVRCYGVDISRYSTARAAPELRGQSLAVAGSSALPFPDASFDLVVAIELLEHLLPGQVERTLRELWRVARHWVFVTVQNTTAAAPAHFFADLTHTTMKSLDWWRESFRRAGFEMLPIELPLAEFARHQILARPLGKLLDADLHTVEARWRDYDREARLRMDGGRWDDALRSLGQAMKLMEQAGEALIPVGSLRSRTLHQLARCYLALGREAEAKGCLALAGR